MAVGSATSTERNIITVLAVDMVGSTRHIAACDPDEAQAFLDEWLDHIRRSVERFGGQIVHYAGDGGIAIFGWPTAYEDHADRACIAAWDIQTHREATGPGGDPVNFRVGIHSGLVGLRKGGPDAIYRFDVAGATVHVAAKLQQESSPGEVRLSAETAELCRSPLELAACMTPARIGNRLIEVYRLNARPRDVDHNVVARRYQTAIVNRVNELAALRERLPRWGGRSRSIALLGEPGIGKSRLATAAMTDALTSDVRCCVFYGAVQRRVTAFAAARALVGDLLVAGSLSSDDHVREALAGLGLDAGDRKVLETLFVVEKSPPRQRPSDSTQTQIGRALVSAFLALALSRPTLLLIEDIQWIDPESRHFLKLLARANTLQPLCILLTGRPEALNDAADIAESVIHLQPLSRPDMETLGRQLWNKDRPPTVLARALDRADGVPFILEEFLRSADATDAISGQSLPQSVESLIHARLQRLSPKIKRFAQTLSLLGEEVEVQLATAVLGVDIGELLNALFELDRFAFIHPLAGNSVRFRHQIIAEACANTIPRDQRREIHRAAILAIIRRYPNLHGRYEQLAFHAEEAGDAEAALGHLWEAAVEARRNAAASSLSLIYDRALKLIERLGGAAEERYVDFGRLSFASMLQLGEVDKVNMHLPRTLELARRQHRAAQVCSVQSQLGAVYWFEGRYEEALQVTTEGLKTARALGQPALIFSNQAVMAHVLHGMGHVDRAIAEIAELNEMLTGELETARLGTPASPKCTVLAIRSWFMNATGQYEAALQFASRALGIASREQDQYGEVLSRITMGRNLLMLHRNDEAVECLSIGREVVERNGYDTINANLTGALATALTRTGQPQQAVGLVEACMDSGMHLRTGQMEVCYLYAGYAEALVRSGESERGLSALDHALSIARTIGNPWLTVECLGLRARLLAETNPEAPGIAEGLAEIHAICGQYGIVAWDISPPVAPALDVSRHAFSPGRYS
ncbi:MAG: AAA family ATPase [Bradyrhizobium sp.]|uniref:ATP-binding protein n=1 Tax=Bradyrhizobium sp. TaxID=376 RepID=UPI001DDFBF18|nr:adenylate/guanylate cyclase domain-containing protein [Bradyrhizobium sp.]MBV9564509.1 AAA family ATPase [Bradyrhizobium sp.]